MPKAHLVAIKIPRTRATQREGELGRLLDEARVAAKLRHTNIVSVFEAGDVDGVYFVATDYIAGQTLRQAISAGALSHRDSAQLIKSLAAALNHAHNEGITHRDVKPENVLIDAANEPHLADFGLASSRTTTRTDSGVLGTPSYMSPEQAKGESHLADGRSDQWSLGVILYELITGARPFKGDVDEVLHAIRKASVVPPRELDRTIPKDLACICLKCLEKDPSDRYSSCREMENDLQAFLESRPVKARPIGPVGQLTSWSSRQPIIATILALLVAGIFVTGFVTWRRSERRREFDAMYSEVLQAVELCKWNVVLEKAQAAIDAGHPNELELETFILSAHRSLHHPEELQVRFERIRDRVDLNIDTKQRAKLQLLDAEKAMMIGDDRYFLKVNKEIDKSVLSQADQQYIKGLNAATAVESVEFYRSAIKLNENFDRAWFYFCVELTLLGRREEARQACNEAHGRFPGDPGFVFLLGLLNTCEQKSEAAEENLDWLREHTNPTYVKAAELTYEIAGAMRDQISVELSQSNLGPLLAKIGQLLATMSKQNVNNELRLSLPPRIKRELVSVLSAAPMTISRSQSSIMRMFKLEPSKGDIALEQLTQSRPEATLFILKGLAHYKNKNFAAAEKAFQQAIDSPAMFPQTKNNARALAQVAAVSLASEKDPQAWERAVRYGKEMKRAMQDRMGYYSSYMTAGSALKIKDYNLARDSARHALSKRPNDAAALQVLMKTEKNAGNIDDALDYSNRILQLPDSMPSAPGIKANTRDYRMKILLPQKAKEEK